VDSDPTRSPRTGVDDVMCQSKRTRLNDRAHALHGDRELRSVCHSDDRLKIVTLSWWTDTEAIRAFAGADIGRARYYPEDDRFPLTRPEDVHHYEATVPSSSPLGQAERTFAPAARNPPPFAYVAYRLRS